MLYTFVREDFFYSLPLDDDGEAIRNAECNPGTTKVMEGNRVVWKFCPKHHTGGGPCYCEPA